MCSNVDQTRIIGVVVPVVQIVGIYRSGATNNNAPVWPGNEILVYPFLQPNGVRGLKRRKRWIRRIGHNGSTADASNRNDLAFILRGNGTGVRVGREHDVLRFY